MPITISWTGEIEELMPILDVMRRFISDAAQCDKRPKRRRLGTIMKQEPLSKEIKDEILNLGSSTDLNPKEIADRVGVDDARRVRGVLIGNRLLKPRFTKVGFQ